MPKLILFVKRKPGLTHEEFRAHYKSTHAPLAKRSLPHLVRYARNYLAPFPGQPEPPYDCVTEFWFDDEKGLAATLAWTRTEEGQILARDEENFMERPTMVTFLADEVQTDFAP